MDDHDEHLTKIVTERFECRLTEEAGKLRFEMATEFGKVRTEMATGFGQMRADLAGLRSDLRAEIALVRADGIERNDALLKWLLLFAVAQTAALAGLMALFK